MIWTEKLQVVSTGIFQLDTEQMFELRDFTLLYTHTIQMRTIESQLKWFDLWTWPLT